MNRSYTHRQDVDQLVLHQEPQQVRNKCHGNRRDQRFRRKYRALNMKPQRIEKMLKKRNYRNKQNQKRNNVKSTVQNNAQTNVLNQVITHNNKLMLLPPATTINTATTDTTTTTKRTKIIKLNKRKRDISMQDLKYPSTMISKSTSSISIAAHRLKKKQKTTVINTTIEHMSYRLVSI
jgi:hypothetical protein